VPILVKQSVIVYLGDLKKYKSKTLNPKSIYIYVDYKDDDMIMRLDDEDNNDDSDDDNDDGDHFKVAILSVHQISNVLRPPFKDRRHGEAL